MAPEHAEAVPSGPLWERDAELAAVTGAVDALCEGSSTGGLLVFTGEAGIGKTAVLRQVRRIASGRCTVWTARGGETVTSVPFHVVRQLLQPALVSLSAAEAREYLGDWYDIAGPALGIARPGGRQADPQGVVDGLVAAVSRLVTLHWPLVLVIDDAHWADQESLRWLAGFAQHLDELPVLLVVAHRDDEATGESARHLRTVGRAARPGTSLATLTAFTPDATAGLTRATLGPEADDPFCREVWAVTGGNPYETVELLAKVRGAGTEPVESNAAALRDLNAKARGRGLVATLEGLGTEATRLAWSAAVLGTNITLRLAAELTGLSAESAAHCARVLREARILSGEDDALEFAHPLIATAVYRSVPAAARTALHGQAAWAVTRSGRSAAEASRHLLEVHPDDDPEIVEQLRRAAREHLAVGAPEAAYRCLDRALAEPPLPETHATVLYELGCAALLTSPNGTVAHLRAALAMDGLEPGARIDAVCRLSQALVHLGHVSEAVQTIEREAARLEPGPDRLRLQAVHYMWEGIHTGEADALERSRVLREIAQPLTGRDNSERALLILRAFDAMTRGENAELVVELCDRALVNGRLAPGLGWTDTEWSFELLIMLGGSYLFADRLDRAEALFGEALRIYEISGWSGGHLAIAHAFVGYVHRRRGRLVEAEGFLRESLRLADRVGEELPMHWDAACMLIDTLLCRGHLGKAQEVAERYHFGPPYPSTLILPDAQSVRGRLLLAQGRTKEAIEELEAASHAAAETDRYNTVLAPWQLLLARAVGPRDPRRARELAADARRQAERFGTDTAIGEALRCAAALETGPRATSLLARSVAYLESSPGAYEHAEARVAYGIAARDARELTRGLALARACGADALAARARAVLREGRGLG